jgi:hypothetical protein
MSPSMARAIGARHSVVAAVSAAVVFSLTFRAATAATPLLGADRPGFEGRWAGPCYLPNR